ncbi:hypothetical protein J3R30DRAFT_3287494 [Lentinula aciculospora]|uniref:Ras GEF n=1 Tax=Lentinula aciculospora TaxID=153920 RepID=A0A9W9DQQ8_9AGAR|nr:hypothetical protein J3R30DRAFT_3287494 [Lentinula aciculospora]
METPSRILPLVPIPTVSPAADSISFAFPDPSAAATGELSVLLKSLPEEAEADIVIANDSSYVETSSAPWAMELKRRYDSLYGVNVTVRSPYAITAFVGQHGQKRYRIGHRELSAPGASAAAAEDILVLSNLSKQSKSPPPQTSPQSSKAGTAVGGGRSKSNSTRSTSGSIAKPASKVSLTNSETSPRPSHQSQSFSRASKSSKSGKRHSRGRISINALLGSGSAHLTIPMTKAPERKGDSFGEIMGTSGASNGFSTSAPSNGANSSNGSASGPNFIPRPFGSDVHFETPAILRSSHSQHPSRDKLSKMNGFFRSSSRSRSGSGSGDFGSNGSSSEHDFEPESEDPDSEPESDYGRVQMFSPPGLPPRLAKFSAYSTEVFDVLQNSRGLPRLDLLDPSSPDSSSARRTLLPETVPVKLSLSQDGSAAPKDDPRFVIWGKVSENNGTGSGDTLSVSHESSASTNSSIGIGHGGKGKSRALDLQSNHGHSVHGSSTVNVNLGSDDGSEKRMLLAATIERWLAQLTSDLDYDELLNFFLTYRTYISALDLARLLMSRFCWALGSMRPEISSFTTTPTSTIPNISTDVNHDDVVRRIVRVRTFVAFKYWLITFFTVDFVPHRELRLLVANLFNDMAKELGELRRESIMKKLKNVAKDCKKLYTHNNNNRSQNPNKDEPNTIEKENLFGEKFAEATRKLSAASAPTILDANDSDVDLDFIDEPSSSPYSGVYGKTPVINFHLGGASTLNLSTAISPPGPGSIPLSSFSILQRTDHAPGPEMFSGSMYGSSINSNTTPIPHNALSRVLVKTLGRLGRWKRVLNSGATACADVSAFDVELTVDSSDLLSSSGGVESYLRLVEGRSPQVPRISDYGAVINVHEVRDSAALSPEMNEEHALHNHDSHLTRRSSRTSSTDSFGEPLSASRASARFPEFTSPWQFDVVTLDELSDDSSDERGTRTRGDDPPAAPPGLRRPSRRLPRRREFEFLERPETVSSMGIISRSSIVSASSASGQSTASHTSSSSAAGGLGAGIQQWQMNALKDSLMDDEEPGDVDDALKRLEGQINPQKQMEKVSKVNGWVKTIRERLAAGDYSDEEPMYSDDDDDDNVEVDQHEGPASSSSQNVQSAELASATTPASTDTPLPDVESSATSTPVVEQVDKVTSPARSTDAKPVVEDAVPLEILQSRLSSELPPPVTSTFVDRSIRPKAVHRSFVLLFKAEDLAQHFAMIDRELFMTIKFEELLLDDWMFCEEVNTLDWAQFLKDRARWKAESRLPDKTSALGAVRARFNLMVNFTMSEVVLTNQAERPYVFSKFLRIAWKSYQHNSFNTLVAIVTGLQSSWVVRAMRKSMNKLSIGDKQILTNLKLFTSRKDNFKLIRCAVDAINDAKPFETTSHASSVVSTADSVNDQPTPSACIPFVGTYLSQLYQYNQLPVLVDPTAPNEVVTFDPVSSDFSPPAHPQVFLTLAPLPSTMHLELLINVHRQRLIAAVIKSLVAGQHLASRVQFPIDKKLFHKCLRIRGLDSNTLQRALALNAP